VWKNKGFRDCHVITVSNDWVLIYDKDKNFLTLVATGSHAKLFPKF
jgi:addiction module RelE/StbE family toxin